jgi:DNA-binding CsgD family transcriptional regulator
MDLDPVAGYRIVAQFGAQLGAAEPDVQAILASATSSLSRIWPATWVALLMNPDPNTSQMSAADDAEPTMAEYVDGYVATLYGSGRAPTIGLSQQAIESGAPVFIPSVPFENFLNLLSPEGQAYVAGNPPPIPFDRVSALIAPMRVAGATIGALAMFDWRQGRPVSEADSAWMQPVADQLALSLEHARQRAAALEQAERLAAIGGIALSARSGQDLRLILRVVLEKATARQYIDAADILLASELGKDLVLAHSAGFRSPSVPEYRIPVEGFSDPSTSRPRVEYASDPDGMNRQMRRSLFTREGFETFVAVPLNARYRLVGMLELYSRSVVERDQAWLDYLDLVGAVAALAIDHATLAGPADATLRRGLLHAPRPNLTDLEVAIMRLIVEGLTNRDISQQVHRSENTIKFHVGRILEKSGAANRTELAHRATREGWL